MGRKPLPEIRLSAEERRQLEELISQIDTPARVKTRALILLMAAKYDKSNYDGTLRRTYINQSIADALRISKRTVITIREHFVNGGFERALFDKPRRVLTEIRLSTEDRKQLEELISKDDTPARIKRRALILLMADESSDGSRGGTHPRMELYQATADALQISVSTVRRIRKLFVNSGLDAALYDQPTPWHSEIQLRPEEHRQLEELIRKDDTPARVKRRAQVLSMAAERGESIYHGIQRRMNSRQSISDALQINILTVIMICKRFVSGGLEAALYDKSRYGKIDQEAETKLAMIARSTPPAGHKRWTLQLLADKMIELGYVDHISDTWVSKILKKANCEYRPPKIGSSRK